jgi:hypothetical protein
MCSRFSPERLRHPVVQEFSVHMSLRRFGTGIILVLALAGGALSAGEGAALWGNLVVFALSVGIFWSTLALGR